jgi:FkbM family methyltransferase
MTEIFEKVVREGDTVIDIGANVGYYTLLASRLAGERGKVYAFEPDPRTYNLLLRNIEINKYDNIVPLPKAVVNKVGSAKFILSPKPHAHASGFYFLKDKKHKKIIEVETEILDHFFQDKNDVINVIKMDIDGGEMDALSGMDDLISKNRNSKMFIEFDTNHLRKAGHTPKEFLDKLLSYNFSISIMDEREKRLKYVNNLDELMAACKNEAGGNLFVTRQPLDTSII